MDASPLPAVPATLDVGCEAVFRTLADGRRHAFDAFPGRAPDAVRRDLDALRFLGLSMRLDDTAVQTAPFVPLDAAAIAAACNASAGPAVPPRWHVDVAFALGSTNTDLSRDVKRRPADARPRLLAAEIQSAGRGRLGRVWSAAPGAAITASFAIPVSRGLAQLDGVTLVCGLAVRHVVAERGVPVRLKWPNDLLVDGRKLAGILVEAQATSTGSTLVIGVGLNVAPDSPHRAPATSLAPTHLAHDASTPVDRNALVGALARALDAYLARFASDGFGPFVDAWNAADAFVDQPVRLESPPTPTVTGIARGVDHRGALLLDVDGQRRRVIAGDVCRCAGSRRDGVSLIALLIDIGNSRIKWRIARVDPRTTTPAWLTAERVLAVDAHQRIAEAFAEDAGLRVSSVWCSSVAHDVVEAAVEDASRATWPGSTWRSARPLPRASAAS